MKNTDRERVLQRLHELEGWAEYIVEALHLDQRLAPMKREMLERVVELQALKQLRELSWSLRDKLHLIATQVELSADQARPELHHGAQSEGRGGVPGATSVTPGTMNPTS